MATNDLSSSVIFPIGEKLASDKFKGTVWLNMLTPVQSALPIGNVTFEPGCRNNWHQHQGGQVLLVTGGRGYYQEWGQPARELHPGDVVDIPAEAKHWHGAAQDSWFVHLAIEVHPEKGPATWLEPVSDEDYNQLKQRRRPMAISETARRNHEELFPNHQSTLKVTDPELIEVFDNFAFDQVLSHGNLDKKTRLMVILASLIAQQTLSEYKIMLGGALNVGVTPVEVKEIVYQSVPYVGIAKTLDYIQATNEILQSRGVDLPLEGQATTTPETRFERGLEVSKAIFGEVIDKMYEQSPQDQVHIQKFLSANCFGDYYTRTGLDIKMRELLTFSMLLSLGGCEPQLKGHVRGNVNVGNGRETLLVVVTQLLPYIGYPRTLNAINCINEVIGEGEV